MTLVVGATGALGTEICRQLIEKGKPVRAMVRSTSDPGKRQALRGMGADLIEGDLTDAASLRAACKGVDIVISTATVVVSQQPGDTFNDVDDGGQRALIDAAAHAGVKHFVFISVTGGISVSSPLIDSKRRVEQHLIDSGLTYTILRPGPFMESWLGGVAGFDHQSHTATVLGTGNQKLSYISAFDVARFAVASTQLPAAHNRVIELGGAEPVTPNEAVAEFEKLTGATYNVQRVPVEALEGQYAGAEHPVQKSFASIMLALASDNVIPMKDTASEFGIEPTSVRDFARRLLS
jgi:uncharacterized protein YbjT (DUF2867 family)